MTAALTTSNAPTEVNTTPFFEAGFEVKGLKTFRGMEGYGLNANLYHKGKKVAFLLDDGNGGDLRTRWERSSAAEAAKKALAPLVSSHPQVLAFGSLLTVTESWYLNECCNKALWLRDMRRKCLKETLFLEPGDNEDDGYRVYKHPYDDRMKAHMASKHPNARIINEEV